MGRQGKDCIGPGWLTLKATFPRRAIGVSRSGCWPQAPIPSGGALGPLEARHDEV